MTGKEKCRILKEIRAQIAAQNDIDLVIEKCTHKGECRGTCPRCESEVRYLEQQLEKRRAVRKKIALAGISAGLALSLTGCSPADPVTEQLEFLRDKLCPAAVQEPGEIEVLEGEVPMIEVLEGEVSAQDFPETDDTDP